jgi:hypothetical protein
MRLQFSAHFRIETQSHAEVYRDDLITKLGRFNPVTGLILACDDDDPCYLSICLLCTHRYREENITLLESLFEQSIMNLTFATMYIRVSGAGKLIGVDALSLLDSLRKIIARADIKGDGLVVGALEPEWRESENNWLIQMHAISALVDDEFWARIRVTLRKRVKKEEPNGSSSMAKRKALVIAPVTDLKRQLSYYVKFVTYDRLPRAAAENWESRSPLKGARLAELAAWRAQYAPDDFLFLYGVKRLKGQFVRLVRPEALGAGSRCSPSSPASPASIRQTAAKFARSRIDA